MWPDNESEFDFINFTGVADTVAEIIIQANNNPISIGVSGAWGVGKSSMIKLIRSSLIQKKVPKKKDYVFVEFNAWLFQGYDDARAALLEEIASILHKISEERKTGIDKVKSLLNRVNWLRAAKITATSALSMSLGFPPVGLIGEAFSFGKDMLSGSVDEKMVAKGEDLADKLCKAGKGLVAPSNKISPPQEIHAIRKDFEDTLEELNISLVVLIDDLDRCLPNTTISTLEAIRLFLFLKNTAFVIAADDVMIKNAVRKYFDGIDDEMVTNYFDKLIQVPIKVPQLGIQEVRAYLFMLYVDMSNLDKEIKEKIRKDVCKQLTLTWQGKRVDRDFMASLFTDCPSELIGKFETAERLAPLMTNSSGIKGNPRLIKRFLNALSIRMTISKIQGVGVDEAALAKMLLFERCGNIKAYQEIISAVSIDAEGKPRFLSELEHVAISGEKKELRSPWESEFERDWLAVHPPLADLDLRGVLYVSREHSPLITPEDRLSSEAAKILSAILYNPQMASSLVPALQAIKTSELSIIMGRLLDKARQIQEWGVPPILDACLAVAKCDSSQQSRLIAFISERPFEQIKPSVIPKISGLDRVEELFTTWEQGKVSDRVKKAIKAHREK